MAEKTVKDLITEMRAEVKWFRNEARRHALNANQAVVATTKIAALVDQQVHLQVGEKLAEWMQRFQDASTHAGKDGLRDG